MCTTKYLAWFFLSKHFVCAAQPLAVKIPGAVGVEDISGIQDAQLQARSEYGDDEVTTRRLFGTDRDEVGAGHTVIFLHGVLDAVAPRLRHRLSELAFHIDEVAGWNVTQGLAKYDISGDATGMQTVLTARCMEYISYKGGAQESTSDGIGWHSDGATLLTMVVMLSAASSFEGGAVHFMNDDGHETLFENYTLDFGDVLAWRGWTSHKARPVTSGHREVMVLEFWSDQDCVETGVHRKSDSPKGIKHAAALDPTSSYLHKLLGNTICKRLPCDTQAEAQEAENAFRMAVSLAPKSASRHRSLANFLGGLKGFHYYYTACLLQPTGLWGVPKPCYAYAMWASFARMVWPCVSAATHDKSDEADVYTDMKFQIVQVFGGLCAVGALLFIIGKFEQNEGNENLRQASSPKCKTN